MKTKILVDFQTCISVPVIVSFLTFLYYGCLLVKVQLTKSAKLISGHSKWFIMPMTNIAKNIVISPNFLVWKFCGKEQFPHSFGRFARNYTETVPFHKISTPRNQVKLLYFFAMKSYEELLAVSNHISVHQKHLRILAIEVYKSSKKTNLH